MQKNESVQTGAIVSGRLHILDPLRFIAAIFVLGYHYFAYLKTLGVGNFFAFFQYGYLGVNFFFMLSGFVIMASCKKHNAWEFAMLRGLRIYPAFIAGLLITLLSIHYFGGGIPPLKNILTNALIINDYLKIPNIDGVYWTLQAELKFYACVFLLILSGAISKPKIWMSIWFLVAVLFHFTKQPFFLGWFISPTYSFYFMGGICAYGLYKNRNDTFFMYMFLAVGIFSMVKAVDQIDGFVQNVSVSDKCVAVGAVFLMYFFYWHLAHNTFSGRPKVYWGLLGAISYPVYLIHSVAGRAFVDFFAARIGLFASLLAAIFLVILISICIHIFIEKPIFKAIRYKFNI